MPNGQSDPFAQYARPAQKTADPFAQYARPAQNGPDPFRVQEGTDQNQIPARTTMRASPSYPARILNAGITGQFPYVHPLDAYAEAVQPLEGIKATLPGTGVSFGEAAKRSVGLANLVGDEVGLLGFPETPFSKDIPGLAQIGPKLGEGLGSATREAANFTASKLRKPATPIQAQMGEAGTIRGGFLRNTPLSDMLIPKGSPGSITRPGPYMRMPLRVKAPIPSVAEETPKFEPFKPSPRVAAQMKYGGLYDPLAESSSYSGKGIPSQLGTGEPYGAEALRQAKSGVTGSADKPFEPLVWESPEEAAARDFRMKNLERQASSAGKYHAAQGSTSKRLNLQQRIGRKMN